MGAHFSINNQINARLLSLEEKAGFPRLPQSTGSHSKYFTCQGNVLPILTNYQCPEAGISAQTELAPCPLTILLILTFMECYRHRTSATFPKRWVGLRWAFQVFAAQGLYEMIVGMHQWFLLLQDRMTPSTLDTPRWPANTLEADSSSGGAQPITPLGLAPVSSTRPPDLRSN